MNQRLRASFGKKVQLILNCVDGGDGEDRSEELSQNHRNLGPAHFDRTGHSFTATPIRYCI
jgi:hypothetical protein